MIYPPVNAIKLQLRIDSNKQSKYNSSELNHELSLLEKIDVTARAKEFSKFLEDSFDYFTSKKIELIETILIAWLPNGLKAPAIGAYQLDIPTPLVSPAYLNLKWLLPLKLGDDEHVSLRYATEMKLGKTFCTAMEILKNSESFRALPKN